MDFKKAFDSLEWDLLQQVIKKFNFGDNLKNWVKIFYIEPEAIIKNNGWLSDNFVLLQTLQKFGELAGLKLNMGKTGIIDRDAKRNYEKYL